MKDGMEHMEAISFFMPMKDVPTVTYQQKRSKVVKNGETQRVIYYEGEKLKEARSLFKACLMKYGKDRLPEKPLGCGVRLMIKWMFPIKTRNGKYGMRSPGQFKATKPDTDNLQKLLKDCMTEVGIWEDDCLVVSEVVEKIWAEDGKSGIYVMIVPLPEGSYS
jgi:Holliday junction resolvase RusA-like endonuclease